VARHLSGLGIKIILVLVKTKWLITAAAYSKHPAILGSNPARGMDAFPHFFVLCCPVHVETCGGPAIRSKIPIQISEKYTYFQD
jgi:hypothetical protein